MVMMLLMQTKTQQEYFSMLNIGQVVVGTLAPTRRVKIKYVEFDGLGYNTADSTNFRAGVNVSGYNGYFDTKITGAAADNSTIHNTSGVTQTGENYIDGCSYTAYNLCSNTTRDGDSYPSIHNKTSLTVWLIEI